MNTLEVKSISKSFDDVHAVRDLSFSVPPGQICGFIGPNGAGKTTAMRIIATLSLPDSGDVFVSGTSVLSDPRAVRRKIGFMPDNYPLEPSMSVWDFIDFYSRARGLKANKRKTVQEIVEFTGIAGMLDKECEALSKGMRQRIALAATLLHSPDLLILDEPAAGLDPRARIELRTLLQTLSESGTSVLISSHILAELSEICHQVVVIEKGVLCGYGQVKEIKNNVNPDAVLRLRLLDRFEEAERFLAEQPGVRHLHLEEGGLYFSLQGAEKERAELLSRLIAANFQVSHYAAEEMDLEQLFLKLTKGEVQ